MVRGLKAFQEHFLGFERYYTIIGGTASSIITDEAGIDFRATKDIDIVLIIEMLNNRFVNRFWDFIKAGAYQYQQKSTGRRTYIDLVILVILHIHICSNYFPESQTCWILRILT